MQQLRWASELLVSGDPQKAQLGVAQLSALRTSSTLDRDLSVFLKASLESFLTARLESYSVDLRWSADIDALLVETAWASRRVALPGSRDHRPKELRTQGDQVSSDGPQADSWETVTAQSSREAAYGHAAWDLLGRRLGKAGIGTVYVAGEPDPKAITKLEKAIAKLAEVQGTEVQWGPSQHGSWLRRFLVTGQADRGRAPAAEAYANSIASLATVAREFDHAYFVADDVALIKTQRNGESVVVGRVLTRSEMQRYLDGELQEVLTDPARALEFLDPSARRSAGTSWLAADFIEGSDGGTLNESGGQSL
jgi:hypothetical protein